MSSRDHESETQLPTGTAGVKTNPLHVLRQRLNAARSGMLKSRRARNLLILGSLALLFIGLISGVPVLWFATNKLPNIRLLEQYVPVQSVRIYDRYDKLAAVVNGDQDRRPIKLSQVSPEMIKSMIGAEDHDFYHHGGINPSSIMRALMVNLQAGRIVEGGSTITQQLVKNLFFPGEKRTYNRKIKEFFLANDVARKYPKSKILEMYLNQIYFGNQSYGIEAAAQRYFNKPAAKLTLGESSFLAGLVRAPSFLSNPEHREQAFARQHQVLDGMVGYGMITIAQADSAKAEKLSFRKFVNPYQKYPYYVSYIMDELRDHYGEQEIQHGLNVYTCLDPAAQLAAEKAMTEGIAHAPGGITQGALVSIKVADAGVVCMVGGVGDFEDHQWNRAVSPHTMGSSFKPFVYLTGLIKGLTPESIVPDAPFAAPSGGHMYAPRNFDNRFMGPLTLKMALTQSRNVCAVRVAWFAGIKNVINTAHLAGLTSKLDPYLPTAVGACAASPLEMAGAYSTIARGGVQMTPHLVRQIASPNGKAIYTYDEKPHKVFDSRAVSELVECMQNVVAHGTGIRAQLPGRPVAGKTGTADKSRDIWFIGFTPDTCTACWGGNDHNKAINNRSVTGGMVMASMWKKYMVAYYDAHPTPAGSFMNPSQDESQIAMSNDDAGAAKAKGINPVNAAIGEEKKSAGDKSDKSNAAADNSNTAAIDNDKTDDSKTADANASSGDSTPAADNSKAKIKKSRKLIARKTESAAEDKPDKTAKAANSETSESATKSDTDQANKKTDSGSEGEATASEPEATDHAAPERTAEQVAAPVARRIRTVGPQAVYVRMPNGQIYLMPVRNGSVMMPAPTAATPAAPPAAPPATAPTEDAAAGDD